ncbi:MAG: threonine/serine exporter family protein [Firmicutes bacterium]|nr:threonine/serine exporter family protein [Bacillota bacterium]
MYDELKVALKAGEIMLRNGSETFRVQYIIKKMLKNLEITSDDVVVIGTAIIVTIEPKKGNPITLSRSIPRRMNNLQKLSLVTKVVDDYSKNIINMSESMEKLNTIDNTITYPFWLKVIGTSLGTFSFTLGFGGSLTGAIAIFLITLFPAYFIQVFYKNNVPYFISNILAGALISIFSLIAFNFYPLLQYDKMIASAIVILTPGIAAITAIRDVVNGDFITGASRGMEALLSAAGLSIGVGFIFALYVFITGGGVWQF